MARFGIAACAVFFVLCPAQAQVPRLEGNPEVREAGPAEPKREALARFGIAQFWQRSEHLLRAAEELESAAKLDPDAAAPRRELINVYRSLGRDPEAVRMAREVLRLDPSDARTWQTLALLLRDEGRVDEAISALEQGITHAEASPLRQEMDSELAALAFEDGRYDLAESAWRRSFSDDLAPEEKAKIHERIGDCCLKQKKLGDAVAAFEAARKAHPDRERAAKLDLKLAEVFAAQGNPKLALRHVDAHLAKRSAPGMGPYRQKVRLLNELGRGEEAVASLRAYLARSPKHVGLRLLLAEELAGSASYRDRREAERLFNAIIDEVKMPEAFKGLLALLRQESRLSDALKRFDKLWEDGADAEAGRALVEAVRGEAELTRGLLSAAASDAQRRVDHEYQTWRLLAQLADEAGELGAAESLFSAALIRADERSEVEIYGALFGVLWRLHEPRKVLALADHAIANPPRFSTELLFRYNRAMALAELKRYDDSIAEADRAIRVAGDGTDLQMQCLRARVLGQSGRVPEAIKVCEGLLRERRKPSDQIEVSRTLANIHSAAGDLAESERYLRRVLDIDPDDATAHNDLGYQWADRGVNLSEAERHVRRAIALYRQESRTDPSSPTENAAFLDSMGWVMFRRGRLEEARDWLTRASKMPAGRDDPVVWDHLGDVRYRMGEAKTARECWAEALRLLEAGRRADREGRAEAVAEKLRVTNSLDR